MKFEELEFYQSNTKPPHNFKELTGFETDYLRVISRAPNGKHGTRWNCLCKVCGEYCVKDQSNISRHKSCGCAKNNNIGKALRKDLSNKVFGKLTAIKYTGKSNASGNAIWLCRCECGNLCEIDSNNLTSSHTVSCGCIKYSIGVQTIKNLLENNSIKYIQEYAISNIDGMNNSHPYRFDFAIVDKNNNIIRFIEYDGMQHYYDTWGAWEYEGSLSTQQIRDQRKNQYAFSHNIPLVRIPYWERDKITLEMIMGDQYLVKGEIIL